MAESVDRFDSAVEPNSPQVSAAIEKALASRKYAAEKPALPSLNSQPVP